MRLVQVDGIDAQRVAEVVGPSVYAKAAEEAQRRAVLQTEWDGGGHVLYATVRGGARQYETAAYFRRSGGRLYYATSHCACRKGTHCVHAVAAVLVAAQLSGPTADAWERSLTALMSPQPTVEESATALAVELSLVPPAAPRRGGAAGRPRLLARVVRPGRGGWVAGNLSWNRLPALLGTGQYAVEHLRLLCEWHALHRTRTHASGYWSGGEDTSIDVGRSGERLWSLLDDAAGVGLSIVHRQHGLGALPPYGSAQLCLDVTDAAADLGTEAGEGGLGGGGGAGGGGAGGHVAGGHVAGGGGGGGAGAGLSVRPVLRVDGEPRVPVLFLGDEGHGVVHVADTQGDPALWPFQLARLVAPIPETLREMALAGQRITVPEAARGRFAESFYPRLRHLAPVTSSDDAFAPPAISEPTLVLRVTFGDGHTLDLGWEWAYDVGGRALRSPFEGQDAVFRDPLAERAALADLDPRLTELGFPQPLGDTRLEGLATLRFSTELLPLLDDTPGLSVERAGLPARYREVGDALRIGLATEAVDGETDWFDLRVTVTVEGREVPFAEVFAALAAGESHLLLADGAYFSLQKPELRTLRTLIEEARSLQDSPRGSLRLSRFQVGLWGELAALGVVDRQAAAWRRQVSGLLASEREAPPLPESLRATLRPYQRDGFSWLCFLQEHGLGGILADDMGLGKTLQTLALLAHARAARPEAPPFLIVAPTSVVANWAAEAARFTPELVVVTIADTLRRRGQALAEVVAGAQVVVTSYTLFRLDEAAYTAAEWAGLVLDEAQFVKNHQSKVHQCARRLSAPFKLAITGTPMENNLMELWSLLSITAPGLFPSPSRFQEHYARPIERRQEPERLAQLRRRFRPLVLRRTKEQVAADLPPKQEQVLEVELEPRHRRLYQRYLQRERQKVLGLLDDAEHHHLTILRSITLLRRLSLHAGLVDPAQQHLGSSKIDTLVEQLGDVIGGGHRALVFSQFTGFLAQVRERLDAEGVSYAYLDGSTRNRPRVIERFRAGSAPVFLISLKAGGFGLTLTEADYCFLLDPWWNPATEAQAIDRTHRIGQTRNVMVYRLIAKDTIEEKVFALARRKAELFTGVMDNGGDASTDDDSRDDLGALSAALTADDLRTLMS